MFRFQTRAVRRHWGLALVGVALLVGGLFPATAAAVTPTCNGLGATIVGHAGDVAIRGTQGPDVIVALDGDVRIDGSGGDDTICAGSGDNIINGGAGNDWINGGDGANTIGVGAGNNTAFAIVTGAGTDRIDGGKGFDTCQAGGGINYVGRCEGQFGGGGPRLGLVLGPPPSSPAKPARPRSRRPKPARTQARPAPIGSSSHEVTGSAVAFPGANGAGASSLRPPGGVVRRTGSAQRLGRPRRIVPLSWTYLPRSTFSSRAKPP